MKNIFAASSYKELTVFECGKEECVKNKAISLTKKNYHLFHYVVSGRGTLLLNKKEYRLQKGMIFFIPRETDAIYFPDREYPWTYEWVGFDGERVDEYLGYFKIDINNPIIDDRNRNYRRYFDDLVSRYTVNGFIDIFALGSLYELFGEMFLQLGEKEVVSRSRVTIQLAKDFINNNYQFDITIDDVARNANVTPNYLSTIFHKEEGMSTKSYLIKVRMGKAMSFLQSGAFNVKQVSEMVGYTSQLHFSNEFKRFYGKSPINFIGDKHNED